MTLDNGCDGVNVLDLIYRRSSLINKNVSRVDTLLFFIFAQF